MSVHQLISFCGMIVLVAIAWVFSKHKKRISWRTVFCASGIQIVFAVLVLKTSYGQWFFKQMNNVIVKLLSFQQEGAVFVFGILGIPPGETGSLGMFFAFQVLTTIIFFSSLMSILYHLGIIQKVVKFFAIIMHKTCRISGAESLSASANIFVGDIEAPLIIKPYVSEMTESELFCVMVGGMATVAGGVMAAYVALLRNYFPDIAGHLLSASVMSAPAAILMAKILIPETQTPKTIGKVTTITKEPSINVIDAAANGAGTGLKLALNVATMLIAFMSLLALLNAGVEWVTGFSGYPVNLQTILGYIFAPIAWIMGIPSSDIVFAGQLMGEKTIINEFVAYTDLAKFLADGGQIAYRTKVILSYALCGFANLLSIGILIGGIGAIAPNRRGDLARLGLYSVLGGTLACFMTATIAGILIG